MNQLKLLWAFHVATLNSLLVKDDDDNVFFLNSGSSMQTLVLDALGMALKSSCLTAGFLIYSFFVSFLKFHCSFKFYCLPPGG